MTKKCFKCGKCCDSYMGMVPKTKDDDLSPEFLNKMEFNEISKYLDNHSELMGHPCKWLLKVENGLFKCTVYKNRSSDCRNYPEGEGDCRVGKFCSEQNKTPKAELLAQNNGAEHSLGQNKESQHGS